MKIKDFSLRIDDDQLKKLHYVAAFNDRSVNRELLRLIRHHIDMFEKEQGKIELGHDDPVRE